MYLLCTCQIMDVTSPGLIRDHPVCYQLSVQKPASLMVWGCISVYETGNLHIWKGTIRAEVYLQDLQDTATHPDKIFFRKGLE